MNLTFCIFFFLPLGNVAHTSSPTRRPVVLWATGVGRPPANLDGPQAQRMATRAAEVVALRNLAAKMGVRNGRLGGFRYVSTRSLPNGSVVVMVESAPRAVEPEPPCVAPW